MSTLAPDDPSQIVITTPDSGVAEMQRVLTKYAEITGYTPANPGAADGIVGLKTAMAVIAMLPRVPGLPNEIRSLAPVLTIMLATDGGQKELYGLIKRNASMITKAIIALEVYRVGTGQQPGATPTTTAAGKSSFALVMPGVTATGGALAPPQPGGLPPQPALTIWFYDSWRKTFRVASPTGLGNYIEVASSASQPIQGTQVSRSAFFSAIGQWWMTTLGMATIGVGVLVGGTLAYKGTRLLLG